MSREHYEILVCSGPTCAGVRHADQVHARLLDELTARSACREVRLGRRKCFGFCRRGPNVFVRDLTPAPTPTRRSALYHGVAVDDARDIVDSHVLGHRIIDRLLRIPDDPEDDENHQRQDIRLAVAIVQPTDSRATDDANPNHGEEKDR